MLGSMVSSNHVQGRGRIIWTGGGGDDDDDDDSDGDGSLWTPWMPAGYH